MIKKVLKIVTLFVLTSLMAFGAKNYPRKNLNLVIPYSAGGGTDQVGRSIALAAQKELGKPVVSTNRTGAGGAVGFTSGAKSRADGYSLTVLTVGISTLPHLGNMHIDHKDFTPIIQLNTAPASIVVSADSEFETLEDLVNYSKSNPNQLRVGNSGVGAIWHLSAAAFAEEADIEVNHIPFEGASRQTAALLGNHVEAIVVSPVEIEAQVRAGKARILGTMTEAREKGFEDVPTLKESGYDLVIKTRRGIAVPKKTPQDIVEVLRTAFMNAANDPEYIELMNRGRLHMETLSGQEYEELLAQDNELFKGLIESLGLKN